MQQQHRLAVVGARDDGVEDQVAVVRVVDVRLRALGGHAPRLRPLALASTWSNGQPEALSQRPLRQVLGQGAVLEVYQWSVSPSNDLARLGERVAALVEQGLDVAEAYSAAKGSGTKATREYGKAMEKHAKAVRKHQARIQGARREAVADDRRLGCHRRPRPRRPRRVGRRRPLLPALWLIGWPVSAVIAVRARYSAGHSVAPEPPALSATFATTDIRREAIGWSRRRAWPPYAASSWPWCRPSPRCTPTRARS